MKYPKPVMRISELIYMGFSYPYLRRAYGTPGQTFATKINPLKSNSAILFERLGWVKHKQPRKPNGKKYTGAEFCRVQQKGIPKDGIVISDRIFCKIGGGHVVAIIDGKVWDIWDSTDGCIGNYFDANAAGYSIRRFINPEYRKLNQFAECYELIRK